MERYGRRGAALPVTLRALVPLTSRPEEERYWYEPGERGAGSLAGVAGRLYRFDRCDEHGVDVAWSHVDTRPGH